MSGPVTAGSYSTGTRPWQNVPALISGQSARTVQGSPRLVPPPQTPLRMAS